MRRFLFVLIFILLGATFVHGWQSSPQISQAAGCVDVASSPDYLASMGERDAVAAINNAHAGEHLPPLGLPENFYQLDPEQQQFVLINLERTDRGLAPLRLDATLSRIARNYSRQMRDLHFFAHSSPIGGTFSERIDSNPALAGHYALVAENLAGNPVPGAGAMYEYMYDDSAEACGHRENILDPNVSLVGIGWVPDGMYGSISAQEFVGPASWNPYRGSTLPAAPMPQVRIVNVQDSARNIDEKGRMLYRTGTTGPVLLSFHAQMQPGNSHLRITWFLDRTGNLPFRGADITLDLSALLPGRHTLLVYAVDGEQNYSMAEYKIGW